MSAVLFDIYSDPLKRAILKAAITSLGPAIKEAFDSKEAKSFDEKLQRSYFLVGKKK